MRKLLWIWYFLWTLRILIQKYFIIRILLLRWYHKFSSNLSKIFYWTWTLALTKAYSILNLSIIVFLRWRWHIIIFLLCKLPFFLNSLFILKISLFLVIFPLKLRLDFSYFYILSILISLIARFLIFHLCFVTFLWFILKFWIFIFKFS